MTHSVGPLTAKGARAAPARWASGTLAGNLASAGGRSPPPRLGLPAELLDRRRLLSAVANKLLQRRAAGCGTWPVSR